jgi:hypothetical protein
MAVYGQEKDIQIAVEQFYEADSDMDARIAHPKKDQNNKTCAIVKMETPLPLREFDFEAGSIGITDTEQKTGEIWIYLSPGTQRLTIKHEILGVIRNYEFGFPLKEATVYVLKLKSGIVKTVVEEDINYQYLTVECPIAGATITIDGTEPEPFSNGKFEKLLSRGRHTYTVEAPLYHSETGFVEVTLDKKAELKLQLRPAFGKIVIQTQPEPDAEVFVDDEPKGKTPCTIDKLRSGEHRIRLIKQGFFPDTRTVTIADGDDRTEVIALKPNFATITLTGSGDIYLDGKLLGANRWSGRLASGIYKVELRKESHRAVVRPIEVKPGEDQTIDLPAPIPVYGSLDIKANVSAEVYLDGELVDKTPTIIRQALTGRHTLDLRADGYKPHRETVVVEEGRLLEVRPVMQEAGSILQRGKRKPVTTQYFVGYRASMNTPAGLSAGLCRTIGAYLHVGMGANESVCTAGVMYRLLPALYVYAGYGAWTRQSPEGTYATDAALEAGLTLRYSSFAFSAGYGAAPFGKPAGYGAPQVGIGWCFPK